MFEVDPAQSKDWLKFHVNLTLEGYAYNTETAALRVAIVLMTLYCIIALAYLYIRVYQIHSNFPPPLNTSSTFHSHRQTLRLIINPSLEISSPAKTQSPKSPPWP